RREQRHGRTGLRRVHVALSATAAMAGGQFRGSVPWGHLEPSVVSGLPLGLHVVADGDAAAAPLPAWTASLGMALAPARRAVFVGAGTGVLHLPGRPETPVSGKSRIDRRLVPACRVLHGIPAGLFSCRQTRTLATAGAVATAHDRARCRRNHGGVVAESRRSVSASRQDPGLGAARAVG